MERSLKKIRDKAIQDSNRQTADQPYSVVSDVYFNLKVGGVDSWEKHKSGRRRVNKHVLDTTSDDEIVCTDCGESFEIPELIQNTAPHRTVAYRLYLIGKFKEIDCNRQVHEFDQLDRNSRPEAPDWAKTYTSNSTTNESLMMDTSPDFSLDFDKFDVDVSDEEMKKFKQKLWTGDNDSKEAPVKKFMQDSDESSFL